MTTETASGAGFVSREQIGKVLGSLKAAADYTGNGAIETNMYENEIADIVRRKSVFLQRIDSKPATGHPHRYFEQTAIATGGFTDPRNINPTPSGPTRVENSALIRAITDQTNLSLFDVDVTKQQGQFAYLESKDIEDIASSITVASGKAAYNGTASGPNDGTSIQYCGILTQITQQATIGIAASIIDGLKAEVAAIVANPLFEAMPTAIYLNPILADYIDREAKAAHISLQSVTVAGVVVSAIQTQAGLLPLISDAFIGADTTSKYGFAAPPSGYKNYYALILTEAWIERPVIHGGDGNLKPRIFQLGLLAGLQGQYVGVMFDTIIAKGGSYAHAVVCVVAP